MALPERVRVKLSSEEAGAISITPVVVQDLAIRDLLEHLLGVTGKDEPRIREVLRRGTLVSGASRFRWIGWEVEAGSLNELLATFPDADPARPFDAGRCVRAVLRGSGRVCEVTREAGSKKGMFDRTSFWDHLMEVAAASPAVYAGYSYRDRADRYSREFSAAETAGICESGSAVKYSTLRDQLRLTPFTQGEFFVTR